MAPSTPRSWAIGIAVGGGTCYLLARRSAQQEAEISASPSGTR